VNLVEKNIQVTKLNAMQKEKSETLKSNHKKRNNQITDLENELKKEQKKIQVISEKFEKSKNEILQLNKGINRKIDQVRKLTFDAKDNEEKYRKAKEDNARLVAQIKELKKNAEAFERIKVTEESVRSFVNNYLELEGEVLAHEERKRELVKEIGAKLDIEVTYTTSKEREKSLVKEVETLKTLLESQEQDLEYKMCSICQEQFNDADCRRSCLSTCGHVFCHKCAQNLIAAKQNAKFAHCPTCRKEFKQNHIVPLYH